MQELVVAQKGQADTALVSFGFSPIGEGTRHLKPLSCFPFWPRQGGKYPSWRRLSAAAWRRKVAL
jgi:hypothetical protein